MDKRSKAYDVFKGFRQKRDVRTMDEICTSPSGEFSLQVQQKFLVEYMKKNPDWKSLLLYHSLGSGKTCSSISMAEEFLSLYPDKKATVILPARLRTNFFDELMSPCGQYKYMSREDYIIYTDPLTPPTKKRTLQRKALERISEKYIVLSFEKFKTRTKSYKSLKEWVTDLTKDRFVIVDEVHNLLNNIYLVPKMEETMKNHKLPPKTLGSSSILFRYFMKHAHPSSKVLIMTATPIFDNLGQVKELVAALNPTATIKKEVTLLDMLELIRGKVSYFPGTSANAYPQSEFITHDIPFSNLQDKMTQQVIISKEDPNSPDKEAFLSEQRQISLAIMANKRNRKESYERVIADISMYAPKIKQLLKEIKLPGKHVVFSNFVKSGLHVIQKVLEHHGYVNFFNKGDETPKNYKVYALWDGTTKDQEKQAIKSIANSKENIDGKLIKIILGSPSIKEGVSFKHIQHLHMMDPVWNQSAKSQVEGRAIRFCSHTDISPSDHVLKRKVIIHLYKSMPIKGGEVEETCDQIIYDKIIPKKYELVAAGEQALREVSIDSHLFHNLHRTTNLRVKKSDVFSPIHVEKDIPLYKKRPAKIETTCPKPRRPDENNECPANMEPKLNLHGDLCCFVRKKPKVDPKTICPKGRDVDKKGKCADGMVVKTNKHGVDCCFKTRGKK